MSYTNTDPMTRLGPGEGYSRRAVRAYHRWTVVAMWVSAVGAVAAVIVANAVFGRGYWFSVFQAGGVVLACLWFALLARWAVLRRRMVVRKRGGRCLRCGYLRPHRESGVCSECGTVPWWDDHELAGR